MDLPARMGGGRFCGSTDLAQVPMPFALTLVYPVLDGGGACCLVSLAGLYWACNVSKVAERMNTVSPPEIWASITFSAFGVGLDGFLFAWLFGSHPIAMAANNGGCNHVPTLQWNPTHRNSCWVTTLISCPQILLAIGSVPAMKSLSKRQFYAYRCSYPAEYEGLVTPGGDHLPAQRILRTAFLMPSATIKTLVVIVNRGYRAAMAVMPFSCRAWIVSRVSRLVSLAGEGAEQV